DAACVPVSDSHQQNAEHVEAFAAAADAPKSVAPRVAFDQLGIAGLRELLGQGCAWLELLAEENEHHAHTRVVPVFAQDQALTGPLGFCRCLEPGYVEALGSGEGLGGLVGVLDRRVLE